MKIKCINKSGNHLAEKAGYPSDYESLSLKVGTEYVVYAMAVWDEYLYYLLKPDHEDPDLNIDPVWYPFEWFEIMDHRLPATWSFNHIAEPNVQELSLIWGYKEIAFNLEHHKGIMEREAEDLAIFYARKKEIDEASSCG